MRVVICGAGIAGLALAGRLHNVLGWDVVVLEKELRPRTDGYMIDFFGAGYDAAEAMGMLPSLEKLSYQVSEAALLDEHGECRVGLRYDHFARFLDGRLLSIMRPDLELALRERLSLAVRLRFGVGPARVDVRPEEVRVTLTDGDSIDADLLVGADGIHSTVRALAFGEKARYVHHLGYHTAAFTFNDPETHAEVGDRFCLTDTVGRQMGLYALRDSTVAVFAVHRATDAPRSRDVQAARCATSTARSAGSYLASWRTARRLPGFTTTMSLRRPSRPGAAAGSSWSVAPARQSPSSPHKAPPWRSAPHTSWPTNSPAPPTSRTHCTARNGSGGPSSRTSSVPPGEWPAGSYPNHHDTCGSAGPPYGSPTCPVRNASPASPSRGDRGRPCADSPRFRRG
ncbi:FAD-dependent monooxygenase [Streptomyces camelliae]|uniref:FAD-dependent monooxygenase n=1 Tax=Streptomyces camelliae TaxID=3004093 RepID=UPI002FD7C0CE